MENEENVVFWKERWNWLDDILASQEGCVSCVCKNLMTGETYTWNADAVHPSASVIKIYLMAYIFQLEKEGKISLQDRVAVDPSLLAESCGVLYYLKDVRQMSVRDLMELMIIVSDNAATNLLAALVGMENLQSYLKDTLHLKATKFRRMMMDFEAAKRGLQNDTSAAETADFLEKIWQHELVSEEASTQMLQILKEQQFDDLIPFYLSEILPEHCIAHKTGGLEGVVHDAAIVDAGKEPFILCLMGSRLPDRTPFIRAMGEIAKKIYDMLQE